MLDPVPRDAPEATIPSGGDSTMANDFLVLDKLVVSIESSKKYAGRWRLSDGDFFIDVACTQRLPTVPRHAPPQCKNAWTIAEPNLFRDVLLAWLDNSLELFRGFAGCHYCWP